MDDYLDSLEFNSLHKIATGMEEGDISVQVKLDPTLINAMDYFGMTPLHAAVRAGDTNTVGFLLEAGADANARDCYGRTPLFYATGSYENCNRLLGFAADVTVTGICGRGALGFGLQYDAIGEDTISLLVRHGIDINHTQDLIGRTLLMQAASGAHVDICRALIECGAEIEALDCSGNPAVLYAILHNRFSNLKLLVKRGATLNRLNKFGRSIINWVARYGGVEIMKILTEVRIEGLPMSPEDIEDYWWLFDNGRHPRFEGVRAPIEHERAAFQAFLDSIIPGEPLRWTPDVERLNIPGSFPQDPEDDNSSLSDCGKGEEDNVDFHDTFEVLQEPQED
jgi:ankyrin repeat protein